MNIAYLTSYLGKEFLSKYGKGKKFALSGPFKSLGIARSLMAAGHEVTVYSPGVTTCDAIIPAFMERECYPEGVLTIKYCNILSKHRCAPVNDWRISRLLRKEAKQYDVFLYYNISLGAALTIGAFKDKIRVIEYEDNIFNRSLAGDRISMEGYKRKLYNFLMARTHGVMAVCLGLQLKDTLKYSVLTPGIVNEDVINNVSNRVNTLKSDKPVHIILTGGIHYSKGGDLLVKAKTLDKDADILINTTRSMGVGAQAAGFPFKMMEYASTGRPIVSSEIGKLDEEYNHHITYYDSEQPEAIAAAVEDVIAHYDEKVQLALKLQKMVLNEYTIEGTGKKLDKFLKEISSHES